MVVGLFFFIRASVKDRTQQVRLKASESGESIDLLIARLREHFEARAYQLVEVNDARKQIAFRGFVRPSWFLASLLTFLAAVGLSCIALVLTSLFSAADAWFWLLIVLAPMAGIFYWRKAGRWERVLLQVESETQKLLTVTAHRDELIQLQENSAFQVLD